MKEHSIAVSVSLMFHIIIVAIFLWIPFDQYIKPKLMVLDFSIEKGRAIDNGEEKKSQILNIKSQIENQNPDTSNLEKIHEKQVTVKRDVIMKPEENIQRNTMADSTVKKLENSGAVASDPAGAVSIRGETGVTVNENEKFSGKNISANVDVHGSLAASGDRRAVDYSRADSVPKDLLFIGDILKNRFRNTYPDRARRMGWEGEVLLSCTISENGTVYDIKVVKSSGRSIFDDHAREILAKTIINRKLPNSLPIIWRTIYQLQN